MIVAVVAVRMMQPTINDVIDVIPVWHRLMTTAGPVHVAVFLASGEPVLAAVGIDCADGNDVLIVVNQTVDLMRMMQMAIMQVVDVVFVLQGLMAATGTMVMVVMGMGMAVLAHR
ncbi:hypothetical protein U5801_24155 [Lamprobacter modestohalophilus]|uniref:hypothetical protein n=1 Tax=Lamprobacter modestohalophilus TaxID=1064514 RepID=UPI002ADEF222|nr:hypothetical protein [Lamprobacter modestohalophilus]MEA1052876.1 hypothetical protein [Lamprobacter modestohalophilus]